MRAKKEIGQGPQAKEIVISKISGKVTDLVSSLKNDKISVIALHPGNVKTKFNSSGLIDPKKCAEKMINFIANNNQKFNGKLVDLNNLQIIDW